MNLFHETDPSSKKSAKIMKNFYKNQPKSQECHTFFVNIKLLFNGHKYLPLHRIKFKRYFIYDVSHIVFRSRKQVDKIVCI